MKYTVCASDRYFICPARYGWEIVDRLNVDGLHPTLPTFEDAARHARFLNEQTKTRGRAA